MSYNYIKNKIVFLILNYKTYWETEKCVQSIFLTIGEKNIFDKTHEIVIVENGSNNDSYDELLRIYRDIEGIHIIQSENNLGFAKGNNLGFKYAKDNLHPQFIAMINSDIVLTDSYFCEKLFNAYDQFNFAVAGPNVNTPNGEKLNPGHSSIKGLNEVDITIKELEKRIKLCKLNLEVPYILLCRLKEAFFQFFHHKGKNSDSNTTMLDTNDSYVLHGCFLIFSNIYISLFDGLYDLTFLYFEETLLRMRCKRKNLKMYYLADISALHNESKTEKYIYNNIKERHMTRYKNSLKSLIIVKQYLLDENKI